MSKKPVKISKEQINKIRSLTKEGNSVAEIQLETKIPQHIVRYHFERENLSQLETIRGHKALGDGSSETTSDGNEYYRKLIEDLMERNKKLVDYISYH